VFTLIIFKDTMRLFKRKQNEKENEDNDNNTSGSMVKCKHCNMRFENKERMKIHNKKAHSGRGERKKKTP
jgi:hypothetical protein